MFDWFTFLSRHRIEFFEHGPNVARGNVNIRCPWCGSSDPSGHMGISLSGKGWGCWRDQRHRGVAPARLIQALLRCSFAQALEISGSRQRPSMGSPAAFLEQVTALLQKGAANAPAARPAISFPPEIKPLRPSGLARYGFEYLQDRKYTRTEAHKLCDLYDLRYASRGAFAHRIIFPVYGLEGLLTWTGRTIGDSELRYKSLSADAEKAARARMPQALYPINSCIFNEAELVGQQDHWKTLIVSEGPFDAMRLDYFGFEYGLRATCLWGIALYERQVETLATICDRFETKVLLLDKNTTSQSLAVGASLAPLGFRSVTMTGEKDPGEMSVKSIIGLAKNPLKA